MPYMNSQDIKQTGDDSCNVVPGYRNSMKSIHLKVKHRDFKS